MTLRGQERRFSGPKTAEMAHDDHQLCVVVEGALAVRNILGAWTAAPGCGVWIPARFRYSIEPLPRAVARVLYVSRGRSPAAVLALSPLARAIVDHAVDAPTPLTHTATKALTALLQDHLPDLRALPLFVPALTSPLAQRVAEAWRADPAGTPRIRDLAAELDVSVRTLERAFAADAHMTLGEWRQRARVCRAIALLAEGMAVKDVALEVGYETASAFVAAFKKYVGTTPGKI